MSTLTERVDQTSIYVQPILFILTMITNILNICILRDRTLRSSPCSHYFISFSISSILNTCFLCPTQSLRRYNILWINTTVGCKLNPFLLFVLPLQASLMLILASFDRFCSSPMSVKLRSMIPISMAVFGILTITNIRQQLIRVRPIGGNNQNRRTESQLARMLIIQISVHMIFALPFGIVYLMNIFMPSSRTPFIIGLRLFFVTWQQCNYFVPFFLYTLSSSVYRVKLFRMLKLKHHNNNVTIHFTQTQAYNTRHNGNRVTLFEATKCNTAV
ncbi:unnamed protein product [Adineta steineri]|uniref:G-protein coupled receptors family 1 profile domain-containing protein n=2 Tax=Adineta steineri TaxID=433720 RepID=A0A815K9N3_9BILA|nr:unnamed protein product [Adineta steineri]